MYGNLTRAAELSLSLALEVLRLEGTQEPQPRLFQSANVVIKKQQRHGAQVVKFATIKTSDREGNKESRTVTITEETIISSYRAPHNPARQDILYAITLKISTTAI